MPLQSVKLQIWRLFEKEFLDNQATIECGFIIKRVRDMIISYSSFMMIMLIMYVKKLTENYEH